LRLLAVHTVFDRIEPASSPQTNCDYAKITRLKVYAISFLTARPGLLTLLPTTS
jgi:hypothetical protein